jgi:hypothetical protein
MGFHGLDRQPQHLVANGVIVKKKKPAAVQAFSDFYEDSRGEFPHKDRVGRVGLEPTWV